MTQRQQPRTNHWAMCRLNKQHCPVHHYHRDGQTRFDGNFGSAVNYQPNSFSGPVDDARYKEPPLKISGDADRYDHRVGNDDHTQAGNLFCLMSADQKRQLVDNLVGAMKDVPKETLNKSQLWFDTFSVRPECRA